MKKSLFLFSLSVLILGLFSSLDFRRKAPKKVFLDPPITRCGSFFLADLDTTYLPVQLHEGLGDLHFAITTQNSLAQKFFDQGLRLIYGFNHVEALRSFMEVARLDPTCAMAYWGQALSLGPNINDWNPKDREAMAFTAITNARRLAKNITTREIDYINAMTARYNGKAYDVRDSLNTTYRIAMQALSLKYPEDPDALSLYADAIMTCMPWNYWNRDGSPRPMTNDARRALEAAVKKNPRHSGAHHFYIHLVEASNTPVDGLKSAAFLETAMPSAGHLVHMPSHIYVRVGEYEKSNNSNKQAVKADEAFLAMTTDQGLYRIGYYPHNIDFLCFGGMMNGQSSQVTENGNKLTYQIRPMEALMPAYYDYYMTMPVVSYVRFGKWNEILTLPAPDPQFYHSLALHYYARGTALLRKGKLFEARKELMRLDSMNRLDTLKNIYGVYNSAWQISNLAMQLLKGELLIGQNKVDEGLRVLQSAVMAEDTMRYNEPPDWRLPSRHFLGAALLETGRYAEAEKVFQEDLKKNPENGWSLQGLLQVQQRQGKSKEAIGTTSRFQKSWKNADVKIISSRF